MNSILNDFIESDLKTIRDHRLLIECLELRLSLMRIDYATLNEYQKNEIDLLEIKTKIERNKLKDIVTQKLHDLNDNMRIYAQELEEISTIDGNV